MLSLSITSLPHWFLSKFQLKLHMWHDVMGLKMGEGVVWSAHVIQWCMLRVYTYVIWQRCFGLRGSWFLWLFHLMFLTYLKQQNKLVKMSVERPHFVLVSCLFFGTGDLFGLQAVKTHWSSHTAPLAYDQMGKLLFPSGSNLLIYYMKTQHTVNRVVLVNIARLWSIGGFTRPSKSIRPFR